MDGSTLIQQSTAENVVKKKLSASKPSDPFTALYPNVASWVQDGLIEIGRDDVQHSFIRVLDVGGMIWEGNNYPTIHAALMAADQAIIEWLAWNG